MAKVTLQQIIDAGFNALQFGTPADWGVASTGYVARLIAEAEAWLTAQVGASTYAITTGFIGYALVQAELCWCRAELWRRRASFIDANAQGALSDRSYLERREYLAHADAAMDCARDWLASAQSGAIAPAGTGAVLVVAESGPFPVSSV